MLHQLQRHPFPVTAHFSRSVVLTYAFPHDVLEPLLPPGLVVDEYRGFGFVAIALVQTEALRPAFLPAFLGRSFFLAGYRVFARFTNRAGRTRRGLRILRSDADKRIMVAAGNLLTHYQYRLARVSLIHHGDALDIQVRTPAAEADLDVSADLSAGTASLPPGSPFENLRDARRFAGPLPFTFDYEPQTHSIVVIEGVRANWNPQLITILRQRATFFDRPPFDQVSPVLASAFHVEDIAYRWKRGVRESLEKTA